MPKLSTLQFTSRAEQGAAFVVMNPLDPSEPLRGADGAPMTLSLYGIDSRIARQFEYAARAKRQQREQARLVATETIADAPITAETVAEDWQETIEKLVALTFAWTGVEDEDGTTPLAFSPERVRALYEQNEAIAYQALAFYYDKPRFFGVSATPSEPSPSTAFASAASESTG